MKKHFILFLSAVLLVSISGSHFLSDHLDVSTAKAQDSDVLTYNGTGWVPKAPDVDLVGIGDNQVLYLDGDSISSSSGLTYDGNDEFEVLAANATKIRTRASGTGTAWMEWQNSSQRWVQYVNGTKFGLEPEVANGTWEWRDQGNTVQFSWASGTGVFDVKSGSQLRLTGKGGSAISIAGLDADDDFTEIAVGSGLTLSSGTISVSTVTGIGAVSGDSGDGQTLVVTPGINPTAKPIQVTVQITGGTLDVGEQLATITSVTSTTFTVSLQDALESGENINVHWVVFD